MADFEFKAPTTRRPPARSIVTGTVVVILVVILIWAVIRHFQKAPESEEPTGLPETSQNEGATNEPSAPSDTNSSSDQTDDSANASGDDASGSAADSSGDHEQQLTDTGPGDMLAVFAGAALLGGLGYQLYIRRRLSHRS
jgi:cytoskeletal protein RodZ